MRSLHVANVTVSGLSLTPTGLASNEENAAVGYFPAFLATYCHYGFPPEVLHEHAREHESTPTCEVRFCSLLRTSVNPGRMTTPVAQHMPARNRRPHLTIGTLATVGPLPHMRASRRR